MEESIYMDLDRPNANIYIYIKACPEDAALIKKTEFSRVPKSVKRCQYGCLSAMPLFLCFKNLGP